MTLRELFATVFIGKISVPQKFVAENAAVQTRNSLLRNDAIVGPALTGAQTSGRGGLDAIYWRTFIDIVHDKRGQCLETAAREGHRPWNRANNKRTVAIQFFPRNMAAPFISGAPSPFHRSLVGPRR